MDFKVFLIRRLSIFFTLTTLILIAICVTGSVFDPETTLRYEDLLTPVCFAACCILPGFVTYSRRELTPGRLRMRMVLELILIEAVILGFAFASPVIDTSRSIVVLTIVGSVIVIYILTKLFAWLRGCAEAKEMNMELLRFQQLHGN